MQRQRISPQTQGIIAIFLNPLFLGMAPIFGKLAYGGGADAFSVAAIRTVIAVVCLWLVYAAFFRRYIYIYPAGLLGCIVVGVVNGIGSLFFYGGLGRLDASLVQLINGMYILIALLLAHTGGERIDRRTTLRVALAVVAIVIITGFGSKSLDWLGIGLMLGSAIMFAGTVILSQYVLYEMPSPTATLYIMSAMAVLVSVVWMAVGSPLTPQAAQAAFWPILLLGLTTAVQRLAMFASVAVLGSLRTAVTAVGEIGVALLLAFFVLGERLTPAQVVGVVLLAIAILSVRSSDLMPRHFNLSTLLVRDVASIQFQRIAFHRAFGRAEQDNEFGVMSNLTTGELQAIQRMMGAGDKPVNPFPIGKTIVIPTGDRPSADNPEAPRANA